MLSTTFAPAHRLVARPLERQGEAQLREVEPAAQEYQQWTRERQAELTPPERQEMRALGAAWPRVWQAATTTQTDRPYLLRLMLRDVLVARQRMPGTGWLQSNGPTGASREHELMLQGVRSREHGAGDRVQERLGQRSAQRPPDRLPPPGIRQATARPLAGPCRQKISGTGGRKGEGLAAQRRG